MLRFVLRLSFATAVLCGPASAAAYDDYSQALAAKNRGDSDYALAKFTAALEASDLNAELVPVAYIDRGLLRLDKDACADAADDFTAALKLKPGSIDALEARSKAYGCLLKFDQAAADYSMVLSATPGTGTLLHLGQLYWLAGNFPAAGHAFEKAVQMDPKNAYGWLWLEVIRVRAGNTDVVQIQNDAIKLGLDTWPGPVLGLFAGLLTPDEVAAKITKAGGDETPEGRQCEANFYESEWWQAQHKPDLAKPLLEQAGKNCPQDFVESDLAKTELKLLK